MYDMIAQLQAKGFSENIIHMFEKHEPARARKVFNKLIVMPDDVVREMNTLASLEVKS